MNWQELLLYVPAVAFIAVTGVIAWRVSKTGTVAAKGVAKAPNRPGELRATAPAPIHPAH